MEETKHFDITIETTTRFALKPLKKEKKKKEKKKKEQLSV